MLTKDQAVPALREAVRVSPDNAPLRQHRATTLLTVGRPDKAEREFRHFLVTPISAASFVATNIAVPIAAGVAAVATAVVFQHQQLLRCVVREQGREATLPPWAAAGLFGGGVLPGQVWMSLDGRPGLA